MRIDGIGQAGHEFGHGREEQASHRHDISHRHIEALRALPLFDVGLRSIDASDIGRREVMEIRRGLGKHAGQPGLPCRFLARMSLKMAQHDLERGARRIPVLDPVDARFGKSGDLRPLVHEPRLRDAPDCCQIGEGRFLAIGHAFQQGFDVENAMGVCLVSHRQISPANSPSCFRRSPSVSSRARSLATISNTHDTNLFGSKTVRRAWRTAGTSSDTGISANSAQH